MRHGDFIAQYGVPLADPDPPRPALEWSRRGEGRARSLVGQARRKVRGRRLAYIDCTSRGSAAASATPTRSRCTRRARTRCSSRCTRCATRSRRPCSRSRSSRGSRPRSASPTSTACSSSSWRGSLASGQDPTGEPKRSRGSTCRACSVARASVLTPASIPAAGSLPPRRASRTRAGSSRRPTACSRGRRRPRARARRRRAIDPAVIDTAFYAAAPRDFGARPLELLFVADAKPRKGLAVALAALAELAGEPVHLHVVGPHDPAESGPALGPRRRSTAGSIVRSCASCTAAATSSSRR